MEQPKQWYIFTESGECVETSTREEAILILQRLNTWIPVGAHNVLTEEEWMSGENPI